MTGVFDPECCCCGERITGRVITDRREPWCEPCRHDLMADRARDTADRLLARNVDFARLVAEIQRVEVAA